ncbi:MAG: WYL domain-containing protein [Clostridia bacterium]|nr:WYL domain-containing protein [Clostridia bacterium]
MDTELEPKKLALIRTLQILEKYSDCDHPLKQEDIVRLLESEYGIELERKAVGRNLSLLKEAGFDINSSHQGSFLAERLFDDSELHLLIDSVLASRHISTNHSLELINRLTTLSSCYFRKRVKYVRSVDQWEKTDNKNLFYNIEIIDEAIEQGKMVQYEYNKFGQDRELHKSSFARVSPYQLILKNQRYYLMAYNAYWGHMVFHRLDRITKIALCDRPAAPLRNIPGYENGLDFRDLTTSMPYFFNDKPEKITFRAEEWVIDQAVDWFGKDIDIKEETVTEASEHKFFDITVRSSPGAMVYWALQFADGVEILSPSAVRERVKEVLEKAIASYSSNKSKGGVRI